METNYLHAGQLSPEYLLRLDNLKDAKDVKTGDTITIIQHRTSHGEITTNELFCKVLNKQTIKGLIHLGLDKHNGIITLPFNPTGESVMDMSQTTLHLQYYILENSEAYESLEMKYSINKNVGKIRSINLSKEHEELISSYIGNSRLQGFKISNLDDLLTWITDVKYNNTLLEISEKLAWNEFLLNLLKY